MVSSEEYKFHFPKYCQVIETKSRPKAEQNWEVLGNLCKSPMDHDLKGTLFFFLPGWKDSNGTWFNYLFEIK